MTKAELGRLGLTHLQGTPLLRAFMHGYFLHNRLYNKARALAEPFAYEAYRQQRVASKLDDERQSRIGLVRKLPRVRGGPALDRNAFVALPPWFRMHATGLGWTWKCHHCHDPERK